jgi:glutathione S-transferase
VLRIPFDRTKLFGRALIAPSIKESPMPILHGVALSPFVRKVRFACAEKGIEYENEPQLPFNQSPEYFAISPLGKIPAWQDGDFTVPDSSVIIDYLERTNPTPALYPEDSKLRARALFLEEYADTKVADVLGTVFFQRFVQVNFFQQDPDQEVIDKALNEDIPPVFDYLESQLGDDEFLIGNTFSIADIAVSSPFVNFAIGGEKPDAGRWPRLAAYVERIHGRPALKSIVEGDTAG